MKSVDWVLAQIKVLPVSTGSIFLNNETISMKNVVQILKKNRDSLAKYIDEVLTDEYKINRLLNGVLPCLV